MGKLIPHEAARDQKLLVTIDTYDGLVAHVQKAPVVFFSHQWQSWDDPDPQQQQYREMVRAAETLCRAKNIPTADCYIFLDYLSIPQQNLAMRLAAINTLGVFSSVAPFFVVVAPEATHADTKLPINKESYQRRGWCRLEQWGHMCVSGMNGMYFFNGERQELEHLGSSAGPGGEDADASGRSLSARTDKWFMDSIMVFEGDYTNPDNLQESARARTLVSNSEPQLPARGLAAHVPGARCAARRSGRCRARALRHGRPGARLQPAGQQDRRRREPQRIVGKELDASRPIGHQPRRRRRALVEPDREARRAHPGALWARLPLQVLRRPADSDGVAHEDGRGAHAEGALVHRGRAPRQRGASSQAIAADRSTRGRQHEVCGAVSHGLGRVCVEEVAGAAAVVDGRASSCCG